MSSQSQLLLSELPESNKVLLFLAILLIGRLSYNRFFNGLYRVPGPFLASITSVWKFFIVWTETMPWTNAALHEKYGPLVRIGPRHVSASSPEALHAIHVQRKGFQKTQMYNLLQPWLDGAPLHNVFSTQDQEYHGVLKRSIGNLYTMSSIYAVEENIDRSISQLINKLRSFTRSSSAEVDMSAWLQYWAFDCIGEINFSQPVGFMDSGTDLDGICQLDHEMMMYFALWGQIPLLEKVLAKLTTWTRAMRPNPLFKVCRWSPESPPSLPDPLTQMQSEQFTLELVQKRLNSPNTEQKDMLNSFIDVHRGDAKTMSLREVTGAAYINVVTAHDVLAITLRAILYNLSRNPACYEKLVREIRAADAANKLSRPVKYSEAAAMPYLSAVINETLRIHPSTGTILERYVPKGGTILHGLFIPEGTTIGVNAWVMNRNKDVFGADVELFRPERWINSPPEQISLMRKNLLTWGAGARSCIGKNMATMQIFKIIAELYRVFDIELAHPEKAWHVSGGWLTRQTSMDMRLTERAA